MKNENQFTCAVLHVVGVICLIGAAACVAVALFGGGSAYWIYAVSGFGSGFMFSAIGATLRNSTIARQQVDWLVIEFARAEAERKESGRVVKVSLPQDAGSRWPLPPLE